MGIVRGSVSDSVFSARLRLLKDERGLTAQDMADQTGVPKRTLEKYMLKSGAASPGIDAIKAICKAFEASSDWLLGLAERPSLAVSEIDATEIAARAVFEHFITNVNHTQKWMGDVFQNGLLYGAPPQDLANDYAYSVLKLRSEIMHGSVGPKVEVRTPGDGPDHLGLKLNPRRTFNTDKI